MAVKILGMPTFIFLLGISAVFVALIAALIRFSPGTRSPVSNSSPFDDFVLAILSLLLSLLILSLLVSLFDFSEEVDLDRCFITSV